MLAIVDIGVDLSPWLGDIAGSLGGVEVPSGVQGQSPSRRSGGRNPPEAAEVGN